MAGKAPDAFRTISEAAKEVDLPSHVLRHWEGTFAAIKPMRRGGGRRYYRPADIHLIAGIKALLHGERYTTQGVQKIFKDQGPRYVSAIGIGILDGLSVEDSIRRAATLETEQHPPQTSRDYIRAAIANLVAIKADISRLREKVSAAEKARNAT